MKQLILMMLICCSGCAAVYGGKPVAREYPIEGDYYAIEINHAFRVTVSDQVTAAVVTVGEKAHERVRVTVEGGVLKIGFQRLTRYNGDASVVIPTPAHLSKATMSGASSFNGNLSGEKVEISLSGASHYSGQVEADILSCHFSGASSATVNGNCTGSMILQLSGASSLNATGLPADSVTGELSGASHADVTCSTLLGVSLSGASSITYASPMPGVEPAVNCPTSGGSHVSRR